MLSNKDLGEYLSKVRKEKDISLRDVEKLTNIGYAHLSMIENGKRNVTPALLRNLATLYNVDYLDLYEKAGYLDLIESKELKENKQAYPLLGTVKAGYNYLAQENVIGWVTIDKKLSDPENYFALRVVRTVNGACII